MTAINKTELLSIFISFGLTVLQGPYVIKFLRRLKAGQTEREEGPQSHKGKSGTPTMGGIMFLSSFFITGLIFAARYPRIMPVLLMTIAFGVVGFMDDYIKVVKKRNLGLRAWQKMGMQILITAVFAWYMMAKSDVTLELMVPFTEINLNAGVLTVPLMFFAILGTVNGTNFTDGIDGLASSVTIVVALFFAVASVLTGGGILPVCGAMIGGLMGFLCYNLYPAKVFMGDTGSLALGGFVAGCAYMMKMPLFIIIVGMVYLVEILSDIIQVSYFKMTHGKRIFKMAPIHHHFEMCGWSETRVVGIFTIVTFLMAVIALAGI